MLPSLDYDTRMKKLYFLLLAVACFIHIFISYQVLKNSQIARIYDERARINYGLSYHRLLFSGNNIHPIEKLNHFLSWEQDDWQSHPHFLEFIEAISWKMLYAMEVPGDGIDRMILLSNAFFFVTLLFSVYGIGSLLYSKNTGILVALSVSLLPIVFGHLRLAMLDLPHAAMISLSMYLLLKTAHFSSFFYSSLLGLIFGLALLTKETSFVFLVVPCGYYFVQSLFLGNRKRAIRNVLITLFFLTLVSGSCYARPENLHVFQIYLGKSGARYYPDPLYYLKNYRAFVGPLTWILSLPFLFSFLINIKKRDKLIFLWFFIPLIFYSLFPNKAVRQLIPILPAFALLVAGEIVTNQFFKKIKAACGFFLISLLSVQYAFLNYGLLSLPYHPFMRLDYGLLSAQKDQDLPVAKELLSIFKTEVGNSENKKHILFLFNIPSIHCQLNIYAHLYNLSFVVCCPMEGDGVDILRWGLMEEAEKAVGIADYVVDKTDNRRPPSHPDMVVVQDTVNAQFVRHKNAFERIAEIKTFDGTCIYVYKRVTGNDKQHKTREVTDGGHSMAEMV